MLHKYLLILLTFAASTIAEEPGPSREDQSRLNQLDERITHLSAREGPFSPLLYDPLMEAARLRIDTGDLDEATDNLHYAQNVAHRNEGVYSLRQLDAVALLADIAMQETEYKTANSLKRFSHFVSTHALSPDDPAYLTAYRELVDWYLATNQVKRARHLIEEAREIAAERNVSLLPWHILMSKARRIEGICCKSRDLLENLPSTEGNIDRDTMVSAYLELADILTLDRKPEQAASYYARAAELSPEIELDIPALISIRRSLNTFQRLRVDTYKVSPEKRFYRNRLERVQQDELIEEESLEPQWFLVDGEAEHLGFDVPDRHETSVSGKRTQKTTGSPIIYSEDQLDNLIPYRWASRKEEIQIEISFTVLETGDLADIQIVESNGPSKLNRLLVATLKKIYLRPALRNGVPVAYEGYHLIQTFPTRDQNS